MCLHIYIYLVFWNMVVGKQPEALYQSVSILNDTNQLLENRHGRRELLKIYTAIMVWWHTTTKYK